MQNKINTSSQLLKAISTLCRSIVAEQTRDCFRVKPAIVHRSLEEDAETVAVRFVGDDTILTLPFVSSLAPSLKSGNMVLVAIVSNNIKNAIVWENYNFR